MTKQQIKKFEVWANAELVNIQKILKMDSYRLDKIKPSEDNASRCKYRYPYREIEISYSKGLIEDFHKGNKQYCRDVLIHEMFHAVTDPFYTKGISRYISKDDMEDEREHLVDHLTNIVSGLLDKSE